VISIPGRQEGGKRLEIVPIPVIEEERTLGAKQETSAEGTAGSGEHRSLCLCSKYPYGAVLATACRPQSDIDFPSVTGIGWGGDCPSCSSVNLLSALLSHDRGGFHGHKKGRDFADAGQMFSPY
jgi:hypothetical protein